MSDNLPEIIDRVKAGNHTQADVLAIVSEISAGKLVLASGSGAVAIGGDASNARIATGNQNVIGDRNTVIYIYGTDSEVIQSVVDRHSAIDNTFQKLFPPSALSEVDWEWGMKLLKQKQLPEIRKRLTDTLGRDRILMDVSIEEQQNWVNRSPLAADRTLQINGEDCGTLDANKMLIETFGRDDIEGKLLILGAPGAGKTTALLSLAEQLVEGAISQRGTVIPVIFELSTWRNDNQSIESWLIEQLYDLHGGNRKSKLYEQWIERQVLLPLLDGLDELGLERQKKCTEKLNEFADHYPQLVVCCRVKEFEVVDIKLRNLRGAVCLQSLSDSQIQHYLDTLKRPELWGEIQSNPSLQAMLETTTEGDPGLLRVPLFVKLVADVYDPQQPISSKADLLDKYIDRQLSFDKREIDRRKELNEYKWAYKTVKLEPDWKKTRSHLRWISRNLQVNNKVVFLIEHMQPSDIGSDRLKHHYFFVCGLIIGLIVALIFKSIIVLNFESIISLFYQSHVLILYLIDWLIKGLIIGLIYGFTSGINNKLIIGLIFGLIFGLIYRLNGDLFDWLLLIRKGLSVLDWHGRYYGLSVGMNVGMIFGMIGGLAKIETVEAFQISISNLVKQVNFVNLRIALIIGLAVGMLFGLQASMKIGLSSGIFAGLMVVLSGIIVSFRQEIKERSRPNQGIFNSLQSQILTTIISFLPTILLLAAFSYLEFWLSGIFFALILGFAVGGGKACLQHLSLRIVLWQSGLPWNFARFLNYCVERRLLLRVGGSYRFLHRELLDHFVQSSR